MEVRKEVSLAVRVISGVLRTCLLMHWITQAARTGAKLADTRAEVLSLKNSHCQRKSTVNILMA